MKVIPFIKQAIGEAKKVSWISRKEVVISTVMVLVIVAISALFFVSVDFGVAKIIRALLGFGG